MGRPMGMRAEMRQAVRLRHPPLSTTVSPTFAETSPLPTIAGRHPHMPVLLLRAPVIAPDTRSQGMLGPDRDL